MRKAGFLFCGFRLKYEERIPQRNAAIISTERDGYLAENATAQATGGWFHDFHPCQGSLFRPQAAMIPRRLYRILPQRNRQNPQRWPSHQRRPNASGAEQADNSLADLHRRFVQFRGIDSSESWMWERRSYGSERGREIDRSFLPLSLIFGRKASALLTKIGPDRCTCGRSVGAISCRSGRLSVSVER